MMQKLMANKKIIVCICAVAVVIVAAVVVLLSNNKEESFRSILVYEIEGSAVIERAGAGSMNAVENLYLESGDRIMVASGSSMRLKLDDDKYVMAEADTIFSVEAEGTSENSKTKICLEQGAVTNEIQHPLIEGSSYETSTPNSVMAVRGTIYRAELSMDENGNLITKMSCFQGKVETTPTLPDGTLGETVLVPAGSETTVHSDGTADDVRDIVYEELPGQAIQNLISMLENGQTMEGITLEALDSLFNQMLDTSDISENSEPEQTNPADTKEDSGQTDANADVNTTDTAKNVSAQTAVKPSAAAQTTRKQSEQKPVTTEAAKPAPEAVKPAVAEPVNTESSDDDNTGSDNVGDDSSSGSSDNNNETGNDVPNIDIPAPPAPPVTYTVTFEYDGKTFATQTVKDGEKAAEPKLAPAQNGEWDFDFATEIKADTTISWK